jgi:ribonuclease HI
MSKKKQKYYVIWKGRNTGIFHSWEEAKASIHGFEGAQYKSYDSLGLAETEFRKPYSQRTIVNNTKTSKQSTISTNNNSVINYNSICVDAACSGNPGDMEYRGVVTSTEEELFHVGPIKEGTNNIGEFLAIVHALAYLQKKNRPDIVIYTDSKTALAWLRNKKAKTKLEQSSKNKQIFDLIARAESWLDSNTFQNKILKWETENWGEIIADFGRK